MIMVDLAGLLERLNPVCRQALEEAGSLCINQRGAEVTVAHLLFKLLDQPLSDVRFVLADAGLGTDEVRRAFSTIFPEQDGGYGHAYPSFSPLLLELLQEALLLSTVELVQPELRSGALFLAALLSPPRYLPSAAVQMLGCINREVLRKRFAEMLARSAETPVMADASIAVNASVGGESALRKYGHDFTAQAQRGDIDPVLCRDAEIDLMVDILSRRRKNNPIVVGDAGVGKSALVEGLALRIVQQRVPESLRAVHLWGLDLGALQAGASVKGEFEKRLKAVMDEVKASPQAIILFIDEAHTLIGAGNVAGGSDAANLLKPALARGELRTIAATTWSEYKKYIEKDPALTRRFQLVKLNEPSQEQALHILRGLRPLYEQAHQVYIGDDALRAAATLSARYLSGRQLPDKAIDVLDTACVRVATARAEPPRRLTALENELRQIDAESEQLWRDAGAGRKADPARLSVLDDARQQAKETIAQVSQAWERQRVLVDDIVALRAKGTEDGQRPLLADKVVLLAELQRECALLHADVGAEQVAQVIADWTGIPAATLNSDQLERLETLPVTLRERIKGQDKAIEIIHRHLLTAMADLRRPGTPLGSFLLAGPSGVGKTETALAVTEALFAGEQFLTVINMSEYQEKHTVSRLLGASPGYVGYGEGGVLTEAIRKKPYSVILLDEIEKAHPEVLNIFYQAFDKGELADGEGRRIDCQNILFFLTSNLGFDEGDGNLCDLGCHDLRQHLIRFLKPALLARMQVVPYHYLDELTLKEIVTSRLQRLQHQFTRNYGATLTIEACARDELRTRCTRHQNGARQLDTSLDGEMLPPLSLAVLKRLASAEPFQRAVVTWNGFAFDAVLS
ncbi:type VI secretion system ATPase TssH [Pseudomonas sp. R5(2019)]|uniref:type VI secretion system ATPase TssH n=1 Tax=Pseudomonas sp. R5(2019) TaxID=2697566 RepID=UPI0014136277|nr:type VI secretion system ATPase TssH [Pseudomonas sp. R5(2019)]NBA94155.1 type VI secretion system ATPase TssH [Pseudomonas sp. R5(2019)]